MYKVQPYFDENNNEQYHLLNCYDFSIVPEVESFLKYSRMKNFSPNTLAAYAYDLMLYYNYCEKTGIDPLHLDTNKNLMDLFTNFSSYLLTRKGGNVISIDKPVRSETTVNRIMNTVFTYYRYLSYANLAEIPSVFKATHMVRSRSFLSELVRCKIQNYNLFRIKTHQQPIKYITRDQYKILLTACNSIRDKIIVALLFEGGLRVSEVCGIHIEDLRDIDHGRLYIEPRDNNINRARVKNHARGVIGLPPYLIDMITYYVTNKVDKSDYLLTVTKGYKNGYPISRRNVTKLFNALTRRTGITVHPHMLRHGFAVEKIKDWELFEVQSYMRHKVPTSTALYAEFTDQSKMERVQEFNKTHESDLTLEDISYVEE